MSPGLRRRAVSSPTRLRVRIILERYNRHLTANERGSSRCSVRLREPLSRIYLDNLASDMETASMPSWPVAGASAEDLAKTQPDLYEMTILQISGSKRETHYMIHPIIRDYYREQLEQDPDRTRAIHRALRRAYLVGQAEPTVPVTLAKLRPFIRRFTTHVLQAISKRHIKSTQKRLMERLAGLVCWLTRLEHTRRTYPWC